MLNQIYIRDFAIITEQDLELSSGLSALTGETGAGKSILLDALGMALGDRADTDTVRHGCERSEISVSFDIRDNPTASSWLDSHDFPVEEDCLLRRVITREGRSRAYINGRPATLALMRELGEQLIDIHGQHEHQSLLKNDIQRELLDDFAGNNERLGQLAGTFHSWQQAKNEFNELQTAARERQSRTELLRFQLDELTGLDLQPNELISLNEEHARLSNADKLLETCQSALYSLAEAEENALRDQLNRITTELEPLAELDETLRTTGSMLNEALINIEEATDALRHYVDSVDQDPERLQLVEDRLALVHELSRKHHVHPEELPQLQQNLADELDSLDHADERLEKLEKEIQEHFDSYQQQARAVSKQRQEAARKLDKAVSGYLEQLGMSGARFSASIESDSDTRPTRYGLDRIEYRISANPGQPLKPLTRVASGGELSRVSLAIQVVLAANTRIPTLIYDEVDTGIGGGVAEVVGQLLRKLGKQRQVLCITHLPQVAAQAHHHLIVSKETRGNTTHTKVEQLDSAARTEELARMLGGVEITSQTRAHAQEMLDRASR